MAGTRITVVLVAVLIQIAFGSKLMDVDSQQFAENEAKETPLKRTSDFYEYGGDCYDYHEHCEFWASNGQCYNNMEYMYSTCPYSCNTCSGGMYYKRDSTGNFGYNPPRARDGSRELKTDDNLKRYYEFGMFSQRRRPWSHHQGYFWAPGRRESESK